MRGSTGIGTSAIGYWYRSVAILAQANQSPYHFPGGRSRACKGSAGGRSHGPATVQPLSPRQGSSCSQEYAVRRHCSWKPTCSDSIEQPEEIAGQGSQVHPLQMDAQHQSSRALFQRLFHLHGGMGSASQNKQATHSGGYCDGVAVSCRKVPQRNISSIAQQMDSLTNRNSASLTK